MMFRSVFVASMAALLLSGCEALQQIAQEILVPPPGQPGQPAPSPPNYPGPPPPDYPAPPPPSGNPGQPPIYAVGPSLEELDAMAGQLLQYNQTGRGLRGTIVEDRTKSGGVAAIGYRGEDSIIYVHPDRRREWTYNTWAFIIGHELSHALYQHTGGPDDEWAADHHGANLAAQAGYDVSEYIGFICSEQPNSCSASHGCFHDRMRALEDQFSVSACTSNVDHRGHGLALGMGALGTPPPDWSGTCVFELPEGDVP